MNDFRPFEEYKEMIQDMSKEEMIKGLYDLSTRITKQENIIKEVREYIETKLWNYFDERNIYLKVRDCFLEILDKGE